MANNFMLTCGLIILLFAREAKTSSALNTADETFDCPTYIIKEAWYECGHDFTIPNDVAPGKGFEILVDSNRMATDFTSISEDFLRKYSEFDTANCWYKYDNEWKIMTPKQRLAKVSQMRIWYKQQADSLHLVNNQNQNEVWIVNNTSDTVSVPMQEGSYICIMQALSKSGRWLPIQYWRYPDCGNSLGYKPFSPKTANSFVTHLPKNGNFETKLRFKFLGANRFYYSNEFYGKVNDCDFVDDAFLAEKIRYERRLYSILDKLSFY